MRLSVRACALVVRFVIILTYIIIIVNTYSEFCRESLTKSQEKSRFFTILFTNLKFCAILFMSHKLNNRFRGIFRFIGILYPFLRILRLYGFGKNANSTNLSMVNILLFRLVCVTTIGVSRFSVRVTSVARTFCF